MLKNRFALLLAGCAFMFGIGVSATAMAHECCSKCIICDDFCDDCPSGDCDWSC